jgi:putative transposase
VESDGRKSPVHLGPTERHNTAIIIYVTLCTKDRKRILTDPVVHRWLVQVWQAQISWLVGRYMIMPDHIHFFCSPGATGATALSSWMKRWKSESARHWPNPSDGPVWQRAFWDTQLRGHESYGAKWGYVEMNPVRAALVEKPQDWPYQGELNELRW